MWYRFETISLNNKKSSKPDVRSRGTIDNQSIGKWSTDVAQMLRYVILSNLTEATSCISHRGQRSVSLLSEMISKLCRESGFAGGCGRLQQ